MFKEISKVDRYITTYKGSKVNGVFYENGIFSYGTKVKVADAWVNARNSRTAINKLLNYIGLPTCKYQEDFDDAIRWGYYTVEEHDYYDEQDDCTYKYYCKVIYQI